jgi:elongation factor 1 alpha-like protein
VQQMQQFLINARFNVKNITFVPMSGLTGINVVHKPEESVMEWYHGPTLLEALGRIFYPYLYFALLTRIETSNKHTRAIDQPLRLVISDVFRGGITNPVSISGRVDAGYLQEGDVLVSIPSKVQATVKAIVANEEAKKWAVAGHNVVVHLSGIDPVHLRYYFGYVMP